MSCVIRFHMQEPVPSVNLLTTDLPYCYRHYDWGLRAIKSVLVVAGSLLRAQEGQVESDVLFRALRDFNIPKILSQDMVIFTGLLQDLFPGVDPPRKRDMDFEKVSLVLQPCPPLPLPPHASCLCACVSITLAHLGIWIHLCLLA